MTANKAKDITLSAKMNLQMRNPLFIALLCIVSGFGSCIKNNSTTTPVVDCSTVVQTAPSSEIFTLKNYLDSIQVTALKDNRGFFYTMDSTVAIDSATHASVCSNVAVTYRAYFKNGVVFDSTNTPVVFPLSTAIIGWKEAVPLMKKNASMTLYLPPSLAYGSAGYSSVPPDAYLIFDIKLYNFQ